MFTTNIIGYYFICYFLLWRFCWKNIIFMQSLRVSKSSSYCFYFMKNSIFSLLRFLWEKFLSGLFIISSVQFSHSVMSDSLRPHESQQSKASLSIANSWSLLKPMSIKLVMPSNHFILYHPLFLLPSIPPSIRVFSNESTLRMRWPSIGVSASASVHILCNKIYFIWNLALEPNFKKGNNKKLINQHFQRNFR